jgi:hypothetical protein
MAIYKIATFPMHGVVAAIVGPAFAKLRPGDQARHMGRLQASAEGAGIAGTVVPVWKSGDSFEFLAPETFAHFLSNVGWNDILSNVSGQITCR